MYAGMYVSGDLCVPIFKSESLGSWFCETHRNKKKIQITLDWNFNSLLTKLQTGVFGTFGFTDDETNSLGIIKYFYYIVVKN